MFRRNTFGLYDVYADTIECTGDILSYNDINGNTISSNLYLYYVGLSGNIQSQLNDIKLNLNNFEYVNYTVSGYVLITGPKGAQGERGIQGPIGSTGP